jgi:hypothetical protein
MTGYVVTSVTERPCPASVAATRCARVTIVNEGAAGPASCVIRRADRSVAASSAPIAVGGVPGTEVRRTIALPPTLAGHPLEGDCGQGPGMTKPS